MRDGVVGKFKKMNVEPLANPLAHFCSEPEVEVKRS